MVRLSIPSLTSSRRFLVATWSTILMIALLSGLLLSDSAVRYAVKERVIALDARWLHGLIRRIYKGQHVPHIPVVAAGRSATAYDWIGKDDFLPIAHGLGPSLRSGQNTLETLSAGLAMGFRLFEVDLTLTSDGHLVCFHGPNSETQLNRLTYAAYLDSVRSRGTTPCQFSDLVALAKQNKTIRFVLDVKN